MPCTLLSQHRLYRYHPSCGLNSLDSLPAMQVMEDIAMPLPCNVHTSCIRYVVSSKPASGVCDLPVCIGRMRCTYEVHYTVTS